MIRRLRYQSQYGLLVSVRHFMTTVRGLKPHTDGRSQYIARVFGTFPIGRAKPQTYIQRLDALHQLQNCDTKACFNDVPLKSINSSKTKPEELCRNFAKGDCKYGDRCFNIHERTTAQTRNVNYYMDQELMISSIISEANASGAKDQTLPYPLGGDALVFSWSIAEASRLWD